MGKTIGYARVSKSEQVLQPQLDELELAGCERIFSEKITTRSAEFPALEKCLENLEDGDTLLIVRLDRLGRSLKHLIEIVNGLAEKGIAFRSLSDGVIDTTTASGELIFHIFAALAQFERTLIQERTMAGLKSARARGRLGGRPRVSKDDPKVRMAKALYKDNSMDIDEICVSLEISRATFYRYVRME